MVYPVDLAASAVAGEGACRWARWVVEEGLASAEEDRAGHQEGGREGRGGKAFRRGHLKRNFQGKHFFLASSLFF